MSVFDISEEFLQEELTQTSQFSKKGGPYSKYNRKKRRDEIFRLHYEYGMSATKIAEMMRVNRHTISKDITFWEDRLRDEWGKADIISWILKIVHRQEIQITRLHIEREKQTSSQGKIVFEKMIMQCQSKIADTMFKLAATDKIVSQIGENMTNQFMKENNIPMRTYGMYAIKGISKETREKIDKMIEEDREKIRYWEFDDIEDEEEI